MGPGHFGQGWGEANLCLIPGHRSFSEISHHPCLARSWTKTFIIQQNKEKPWGCVGEGFCPRATELCWEEASGSNQPGTADRRGGGCRRREAPQAVAVPSVGNSALLMTQVLEVLQAGRLINYFPKVSLKQGRETDAWWAWKKGPNFQLVGNLFPGLTAATCEGIENICASDKRSHLKGKTRMKPAQQRPVSHQTPSSTFAGSLCS